MCVRVPIGTAMGVFFFFMSCVREVQSERPSAYVETRRSLMSALRRRIGLSVVLIDICAQPQTVDRLRSTKNERSRTADRDLSHNSQLLTSELTIM